MIREDTADVVYADKDARRRAVVGGDPQSACDRGIGILVGTASVEESEALSRELLQTSGHSACGAECEERRRQEAEIVGQAGAIGARDCVDEYGGPRNGYSAGRESAEGSRSGGGAGRAVCDRDDAA